MSSKVRLLSLLLCLSVVVILAGRKVGVFLSTAVNRNGTDPVVMRDAGIPENWYEGSPGYAEAAGLGRDSHVAMIVYFRTDWCPYCKRFDRDIMPSAEVATFLKTIIKVRVNPEQGPNELALANSFGVHGYPSIFMVPANGEAPVKVYPFVRSGETFQPVPPAEFVASCRRAAGW
jgi:hypothetical protein